VPAFLRDALRRRAEHPIYGCTFIDESFYQVTARWQEKRHGWTVCPDWVLFLPGIASGIHTILRALTEPSGNIVILGPASRKVIQAATDTGRKVHFCNLFSDRGGWRIDFNRLKQCIAGSGLLILVNPHTPTGKVFTKRELGEIGALCRQSETGILSIESGSDLVLPVNTMFPAASVSEDLAEITATMVSPGAAFYIEGLHTAAAIVPNPALKNKIQAQADKDRTAMHNIFGLTAYLAAWQKGAEHVERLRGALLRNLDLALKKLEGFRCAPIVPQAGGLLWLDCNGCGSIRRAGRYFMKGDPPREEYPDLKGLFPVDLARPSEKLAADLDRYVKILSPKNREDDEN